MVALGSVAAELANTIERLGVLDAFGNNLESAMLRVLDRGSEQAGSGSCQVDDESAVDLETVEWEIVEQSERGISAAEVVELDANTRCTEALQNLDGPLAIDDERR
ncbi:MAG: hypothetical protein QOJ66_2730, partial [Ilumatobacteraceae bacterium]